MGKKEKVEMDKGKRDKLGKGKVGEKRRRKKG